MVWCFTLCSAQKSFPFRVVWPWPSLESKRVNILSECELVFFLGREEGTLPRGQVSIPVDENDERLEVWCVDERGWTTQTVWLQHLKPNCSIFQSNPVRDSCNVAKVQLRPLRDQRQSVSTREGWVVEHTHSTPWDEFNSQTWQLTQEWQGGQAWWTVIQLDAAAGCTPLVIHTKRAAPLCDDLLVSDSFNLSWNAYHASYTVILWSLMLYVFLLSWSTQVWRDYPKATAVVYAWMMSINVPLIYSIGTAAYVYFSLLTDLLVILSLLAYFVFRMHPYKTHEFRILRWHQSQGLVSIILFLSVHSCVTLISALL